MIETDFAGKYKIIHNGMPFAQKLVDECEKYAITKEIRIENFRRFVYVDYSNNQYEVNFRYAVSRNGSIPSNFQARVVCRLKKRK